MIYLSGVGCGGIMTINPYIRRLIAALENIVGILNVGVVVARLVSAYRARVRHQVYDAERSRKGTPH